MNFLVDGNWYLHRAYSIAGQVDPKDAVAKLFVSLICKDALATRSKKLFVGFDGSDIFRYKLYKKYKANRSEGSGEQTDNLIYKISMPHVQNILNMIGISWLQEPEYEADDLLVSTSKLDGTFILGAQDKDYYQALNKRVQMYCSVGNARYITVKDCKAKFGLPPKKMVMYQSLIGDSIDNIPQILSPAKAKQLCLEYDSLQDVEDPELKEFLLVNKARIQRNKKLVKLVTNVPGIPTSLKSDAHRKWSLAPRSLVNYVAFVNPKTKSLF